MNEIVQKEAIGGEIPEAFLCPIYGTLMDDPVISTVSERTYERSAIEQWLENNSTDPITKQKMTKTDLRSNRALKDAISWFKTMSISVGMSSSSISINTTNSTSTTDTASTMDRTSTSHNNDPFLRSFPLVVNNLTCFPLKNTDNPTPYTCLSGDYYVNSDFIGNKLYKISVLNIGNCRKSSEFIRKVSEGNNDLGKSSSFGVSGLDINGIKLQIWNMNNVQGRFQSNLDSSLKDSVGFVLMYDLADKKSYGELDDKIRQIRNNPEFFNCQILVLGNSTNDTDEELISSKIISELVKSEKCIGYSKISINTGQGCKDALKILANSVAEDSKHANLKNESNQISQRVAQEENNRSEEESSLFDTVINYFK